MKKFDLDSKIRSIHVPERDPEFWDQMPGRILQHTRSGGSSERRHHSFLFHCVLATAKFSMACAVVGLCLWQTGLPQTLSRNLLRDERALRQSLDQVPKHLEAMMQDEHGLHYLVQDLQ